MLRLQYKVTALDYRNFVVNGLIPISEKSFECIGSVIIK